MTGDGLDAAGRRAELAQRSEELRAELHRYAARLVGSVIDGEDVVQEAFARAFAALGDLAVDTPMRPWLFRIVHNQAIDHLRRTRTRMAEPLDAASEVEDIGDDGEAAYLRSEAVGLAAARFAGLPLPQRSAVVLKDVLGESLSDIAALLDMSTDAVKAHLARGRARLRTLPAPALPTTRPPSPEAATFAALFNRRDWDGLRRLLARDVVLRQSRHPEIAGSEKVGQFFSHYAGYPRVTLMPAWIEGHEALVVAEDETGAPRYFMLLDWQDGRIARIRDHRYARYVMDGAPVVPAEA